MMEENLIVVDPALFPPTPRDIAKAQRQALVDAIVVTTSAGNAFNGDEVSQDRMARAIVALTAAKTASINWTLADNTVIQASVPELSEALVLAGQAQAEVWVI